MLDTLFQATPPGRKWPLLRESRALVLRGLRARGWAWLASMLWMVAGAANAVYYFYVTTKPFGGNFSIGIRGWAADAQVVRIALILAIVVWLALLLPVLFAGLFRLRGSQPGDWVCMAAWTGAWMAGIALMGEAIMWGIYPGQNCYCKDMPRFGSPALVSWGELELGAGWLVLGVVMTVILGWSAPAGRRARAGGRAEVGPG